jgi:serine O-acetyltransferase
MADSDFNLLDPTLHIDQVVAELLAPLPKDGHAATSLQRAACNEALPSRRALGVVVEALRAVLFPGYFGEADHLPETLRAGTLALHLGSVLDRLSVELEEQIRRAICFGCSADSVGEEPRPPTRDCGDLARAFTAQFIHGLPEIRRVLATDVQAAFDGDPAARSPGETILCYPGILAVTSHRIAHALFRLGVPLLPRMISELSHSQTGIDIHPGASIGEGFFIDHGTGVVIGETCIIGRRVRIYQGVTLGARSFQLDDQGHPVKGLPRHPIVEDEVVIYAGATILGRVTIGAGSIIGGNAWLTRSVPPNSRISSQQAKPEGFSEGAGI